MFWWGAWCVLCFLKSWFRDPHRDLTEKSIHYLHYLTPLFKSLWHEPRPKHLRTVRGFNWGKIIIFRSMLIWYSYSYYMFTFIPALCCSETLPSVRQEISRRSSTTLATFVVWGGLGPVVRKWTISSFNLPSHNYIHIAKYLFSIKMRFNYILNYWGIDRALAHGNPFSSVENDNCSLGIFQWLLGLNHIYRSK